MRTNGNANAIEEEVDFYGWANGGSALGKLADGRVVFVKGVLPGERARVRYTDREARFVSAALVRLLMKSPMRIEPRCPLYGSCARCCLQNLEYPDQLHAKREILIDHLTRIAKVPDAAKLLRPMVGSPLEWGYARSLTLYPAADGSFCLPDEHGAPLRLEAYCPIAAECLNEALPDLTLEEDSGIEKVELRAGDEDELQLLLRGAAEKPDNEMENESEISVIYQGPASSWVMSGVSTLTQTAAGLRVCASDTSPFLLNPAALTAFCEKFAALLPESADVSLLDIHAGTGFWSRWFAPRCEALTAVMEEESLSEDYILNLNDAENVSLYIAPVREALGGIPAAPREWVFIEGGKSGLNEEDIAALCGRAPEKLFFFAEDAAILARDVRRILDHGRRLSAILPLDPAPQTADLAALAIFE